MSSSSIGNACNVVDEESMGEGVSSCCFCNKDLVDDDVGGGRNAQLQCRMKMLSSSRR